MSSFCHADYFVMRIFAEKSPAFSMSRALVSHLELSATEPEWDMLKAPGISMTTIM
jgi:hypothetical protein